MAKACDIDYDGAVADADELVLDNVRIPLASKRTYGCPSLDELRLSIGRSRMDSGSRRALAIFPFLFSSTTSAISVSPLS